MIDSRFYQHVWHLTLNYQHLHNMLFLIYSSNRYKIVEFQMFKAKTAAALKDRNSQT